MSEGPSLKSMSSCLSVTNTVLASGAAIMLLVVCFTNNTTSETHVHSTPFMVVTDTIAGMSVCIDIGLKSFCISYCGSDACMVIPEFPTFQYSRLLDLCPIPPSPTDTAIEAQEKLDTCTTIQQCDTGGKVTFAFALIACLGAVMASAACYHRLKDTADADAQQGIQAKKWAVWLSGFALTSAIISYSAMQWCAHGFDSLLSSAYSSVPAGVLVPQMILSVSPGAGGVLNILAFVSLLGVLVLNVIMPASGMSDADTLKTDNLRQPLHASA